MLKEKTKDQAIKEILCSVGEYYDTFMQKPAYKVGDRISYAGRVFDKKEMENLVESSLEFWLTSGKWTDLFEAKLASYLGVKYASFVNSGSSANLLAFMALTAPELGERAIKRGDEVITVAAGFPTTVTPILDYGAVPVFVDVTIPTYNIDISMLELALSPKTKAVMLAHTLGNPFDIKSVKDFCIKNKLWLIEDNCDALGSKYTLDGSEQFTGTFGDIATSSFYPAHHITTGEGGAVYTNDATLNKIVRSFRDWGRDCVCPSGKDGICGHRFDRQMGTLPLGYDHKYTYSHFGYNLKASDMQAAIGVAQLEKLTDFTKKRRENFTHLYKALEGQADKIILPEATKNSVPSWFGFLITCREGVSKDMLVADMESHKIQTRALFAGNLTRHPCFDYIRGDNASYRIVGNLNNTDRIMKDTFWIGVYPGMLDSMLDTMANTIISTLNRGGGL